MSLKEFCEVREGTLVPAYEKMIEAIPCDWCDCPTESVLSFGALWVCPECFDKAEKNWKSE